MTAWTTFEGDDASWDELIDRLGGTSPFATSGWARIKSSGRWTTARAIAVIDGVVVASAQVFWMRILGTVAIGWIPGGIVSRESLTVAGLTSWFSKSAGANLAYIRAAFHSQRVVVDEDLLIANSWQKAPSFIGARETFIVKRLPNGLADLSRLTPNWRRNLERGLKRNQITSIPLEPNATDINSLMRELVEFKKDNGPQSAATDESLQILLKEMRKWLLIVEVRDLQGRLLSVRGAFVRGDFAWDAIAATGVIGRKNYSSYVCAWKLMEELDNRGINTFDLAGIDEIGNVGVFNFKKGIGGDRTTYLGEWDWSSISIVRILARFIVSRLG